MKEREIRGIFDQETITVYQAYSSEIAVPAIKKQTFIAPFKMERMTWIKPSFLWMMYRCGWAQKKDKNMFWQLKLNEKAGNGL